MYAAPLAAKEGMLQRLIGRDASGWVQLKRAAEQIEEAVRQAHVGLRHALDGVGRQQA